MTGWCLFLLFFGSPVLAFVVFPLMRIFVPAQQFRATVLTILQRACALYTSWARRLALIDYGELEVHPQLDLSKPYVLIANHPSLVDTMFLLGMFPRMTCVAKSSWYHSFALGGLLRAAQYVQGPSKDDEDGSAFQRVVTQLAHHPLLIFPEGTRSLPERLNRFRSGAFEAAVQAGVPIAALFIRADRAMLLKGQPWYVVPDDRGRFEFEWIEIVDTVKETDAKQIKKRLEARYRELYQEVLSARETRAASGASAS